MGQSFGAAAEQQQEQAPQIWCYNAPTVAALYYIVSIDISFVICGPAGVWLLQLLHILCNIVGIASAGKQQWHWRHAGAAARGAAPEAAGPVSSKYVPLLCGSAPEGSVEQLQL